MWNECSYKHICGAMIKGRYRGEALEAGINLHLCYAGMVAVITGDETGGSILDRFDHVD